jgi:ABC-type multidrug transport system fused ATPase/permease subunit
MKEDFLLFKRVWKVVKPFHKKFFILFFIIISSSVLSLVAPYLFGQTIDQLTVSNFNLAYLFAGLTIFFWILHLIIELTRDLFEIKNIDTPLQGFFSSWTFNKMFDLSLGQFRGENSGYRQRVFEKGQGSISFLIQAVIYTFAPILFRSLITSIALFFINIWLGIILFITLILYLVSIIYVNNLFKDDFKKNSELWGIEGKEYSENLRYLAFIKANSQEKKAIKSYIKTFKKIEQFTIPLWTKFITYAVSLQEGLVIIAQGATLLFGIFLTVQGEISVGLLIVFYTWSSSVFNGIQFIGNMHRRLINQIGDIRTLFEILDEPPAVVEIEDPIKLENIKGEIEFKNVSFAYPARKKGNDEKEKKNKKIEEKKDKPVLKGVSFKIESDKTTAFVGRSGSGKTTIINLLLRAYDPQRGEIMIDGVNLRDLDLEEYRKHLGVVEQEVEVFDKTIKYNVLFPINNPKNFTNKDLEQISKDSGMSEFKSRLTHGFDTKIGEKGIQLSGGQKQRVGIARVLAKKPDILIFDEATSNLDSINEKKIHKAMKKALKGRTGIIIAHRLATVMDADKIIVFDKGKVVGTGTHQDLLKKCKEYKELVNLQNLELSE